MLIWVAEKPDCEAKTDASKKKSVRMDLCLRESSLDDVISELGVG